MQQLLIPPHWPIFLASSLIPSFPSTSIAFVVFSCAVPFLDFLSLYWCLMVVSLLSETEISSSCCFFLPLIVLFLHPLLFSAAFTSLSLSFPAAFFYSGNEVSSSSWLLPGSRGSISATHSIFADTERTLSVALRTTSSPPTQGTAHPIVYPLNI